MKEITLQEAKRILKEIEEFKKNKKCKDYRDLLPVIEKYGFELETLGTGHSAYTYSCDTGIKNIKSRKYLNGIYLVIGVANTGGKKGVYYRGYVLKIKTRS